MEEKKNNEGISTVKNEDFIYEVSREGNFVLSDKGSIPNETEQMKKEYHKQRRCRTVCKSY